MLIVEYEKHELLFRRERCSHLKGVFKVPTMCVCTLP